MNPEPGTNTSFLRACGHGCRYGEVCEPVPNALVVDAEDSEILRLNLIDVALVCNRQRAPKEVVRAGRVVLFYPRPRARVVGLVGVANVTTLGRSEVRGRTLVACQLSRGGSTGGKFEEISVVGRVVKVSVEPPSLKYEIQERCYWAVIGVAGITEVVEGSLVGDIESPHRGMPYCCVQRESRTKSNKSVLLTDVRLRDGEQQSACTEECGESELHRGWS